MRPGLSVTKLTGEYTGRRKPEEPWRRRAPYPLLDVGLIEGAKWCPVASGRCNYDDYIALREGFAVVKLVRGLASCTAAHGFKALSLQDNSAVSSSFSKGRSAVPALNYVARQRAGSSIASGVQALLPWVESARQPVDGLSREVPMPPTVARRQEIGRAPEGCRRVHHTQAVPPSGCPMY